MPIKTIIIDDEANAINLVRTLCEQNAHALEVVDTCTQIGAAINSIARHSPQLIFLDIQFVNGLGFDVLKAFPEPDFHTVFISAFDQYAMRALKHHAFDYLLKPIDTDEFNAVVNDLTKRIDQTPKPRLAELKTFVETGLAQKIGVPTTFGTDYYHVQEMIRLQADGAYIQLILESGQKVTVCRRLKDFEAVVQGKGFIRIHRSHIVNLNHIKGIHKNEGGYLTMSNGDKVPIARKEWQQVSTLLKNLVVSL